MNFSTTKSAYRPEIDGLRAIAVTAVILYHAKISFFGWEVARSGFLGVDVFFVISGYLISKIILANVTAGTFTYREFYERRARRILPALLIVTVACWPAAWLYMTSEQFENFSRSVTATSLLASNVFFWLDTSYFSEAISLKPLSHTWSLGVEEQFYALYPLCFVFVLRKRWSATLSLGLMGWDRLPWRRV